MLWFTVKFDDQIKTAAKMTSRSKNSLLDITL